jgi:hypothetical protein
MAKIMSSSHLPGKAPEQDEVWQKLVGMSQTPTADQLEKDFSQAASR